MIISTRHVDEVAVFGIEGGFRRPDLQKHALYDLVRAQLDSGRERLIIDLTKAGQVDSFGIGEILECHVAALNAGAKLKVARDLGEWFRMIPDPHPIPEFLYASVEEALNSFRACRIVKKRWQFWKS